MEKKGWQSKSTMRMEEESRCAKKERVERKRLTVREESEEREIDYSM